MVVCRFRERKAPTELTYAIANVIVRTGRSFSKFSKPLNDRSRGRCCEPCSASLSWEDAVAADATRRPLLGREVSVRSKCNEMPKLTFRFDNIGALSLIAVSSLPHFSVPRSYLTRL
jgi:hypothetical protein